LERVERRVKDPHLSLGNGNGVHMLSGIWEKDRRKQKKDKGNKE
jgi:hypothetical protein